jgi:4-alpha-glucanotransferase
VRPPVGNRESVLGDWVDAWGVSQTVAAPDLALVTSLLGSFPSLELEPVYVAWDGVFPASSLLEGSSASVVTEEGDRLELLDSLPFGYHRLHVEGIDEVPLVISAPMKAHPGPSSALGVFAPLYELRSEGDRGIGNLGGLRTLAEGFAGPGVTLVGTTPMLAKHEQEKSPYSPVSRRFWGEHIVDFSGIAGLELGEPRESGALVDNATVSDDVAGCLDAYIAQIGLPAPELIDEAADRYAKFRSIADRYGKDWGKWPAHAQPDAERVSYHLMAQWLADQQLAELAADLAKSGQALYLDLPIGAVAESYDVWTEPDAYAAASLGAPPDDLFRGGQSWGLPAMIPEAGRRSGHANFRTVLRHHLEHAGVLRVDHILGLYRTWWVPTGRPATAGAYVLQPMDELFAILCLESVRAETAIVGENLGTIPREIEDALQEHGIMGMRVPQFGMTEPTNAELIALTTHDIVPFVSWWTGADIDDMVDLGLIDGERPAAAYANRVLATHELEKKFESTGPQETLIAMHRWMGESESPIAMIALDDLVGETRRHNVPGTTSERPNWQLRLPQTVEQITGGSAILAHLREVAILREG